uniref:Uncharacterized protein n=1 Tax=Manihot esculenta TaxID=3983 RepID=A0A2C9VUI6_MANES
MAPFSLWLVDSFSFNSQLLSYPEDLSGNQLLDNRCCASLEAALVLVCLDCWVKVGGFLASSNLVLVLDRGPLCFGVGLASL